MEARTLFSFSEYASICEAWHGFSWLQPGHFSIARYENQELHVVVQSSISGQGCLVVGSIAPPEQQMASTLLLAHTLKKEGAKHLAGVFPYLAYTRQDKLKPGESLATAWVGSLLKASGFDDIWTVDLHSEHDKKLFPLNLVSFSPAGIFAERVTNHGLTDASIVAPDNGAIPRCEAVKSAAGMTSGDIVYFDKRRTTTGIVHDGPIGKVGSKAVIVDDILDTGGTLVSACRRLVGAGAEELYIFVTHGLFTGELWKNLWSLRVRHIFCTDTIPGCANIQDPRISVLPVGPLLREKLASVAQGSLASPLASNRPP